MQKDSFGILHMKTNQASGTHAIGNTSSQFVAGGAPNASCVELDARRSNSGTGADSDRHSSTWNTISLA